MRPDEPDPYAPPRAARGPIEQRPRPLLSAIKAYLFALPGLVLLFGAVDTLPTQLSSVLLPDWVAANRALFNVLCVGLEGVLFPLVLLASVGMTGPLGVRATVRQWPSAAAAYLPLALATYALIVLGNRGGTWDPLLFFAVPLLSLPPAMLLDAPGAIEGTGSLLRRSPLRIMAAGLLMLLPCVGLVVLNAVWLLQAPTSGWLAELVWFAGWDVIHSAQLFWYVGVCRALAR